jgi:dTDP-4-dehydrorhamnose reductase
MHQSILILGRGQVGAALEACANAHGFTAHVLDRDQFDIATATAAEVEALLQAHRPVGLLNAAAYTQVDKAEGEGRAEAFAVNAAAPAVLAKACKQQGVLFVHYSTDYVFDGSGQTPWREEDAPCPINAYGESKLEGEQAVVAAGGQHLIFRTSWVYDARGKNFLNTMLRLASERETLSVVSDQIGAPTYAGHIAEATLNAVRAALAGENSGVFHLVNAGETSWYGFAEAIFASARARGEAIVLKELNAIPSSAYPTPAKRPLNSRLDCNKLSQVLGVTLPTWQEGLEACMKVRYASH